MYTCVKYGRISVCDHQWDSMTCDSAINQITNKYSNSTVESWIKYFFRDISETTAGYKKKWWSEFCLVIWSDFQLNRKTFLIFQLLYRVISPWLNLMLVFLWRFRTESLITTPLIDPKFSIAPFSWYFFVTINILLTHYHKRKANETNLNKIQTKR